MTFVQWLSKNYDFIFILVIIGYTIISNSKMYSSVRKKFIALAVLTLLEAFISQLEDYFSTFEYRNVMRYLLSTAGYIIRPTIIYVILLIVVRTDSVKRQIMYGIPLALVSLILIIDLPFGNVYYFTESNNHATGKLFFLTYGILVLYLIMIVLFIIIKCDLANNIAEFVTVLVAIGFVVINIIGETVLDGFSGHTQVVIALAVLIYAIYFKSTEDRIEKTQLEMTEIKTGLFNEHACVALINQKSKEGTLTDYATIYFDLVRFGLINDQYGMEIGNVVLVEYAKKLSGMLRSDEILARQGSDRFIAVVLKRNLDIILDVLKGMEVKFKEDGDEYDVNISAHMGIYKIDDPTLLGEEIISNAYSALTYGKSNGNEITYLTPELKQMLRDQKQFGMDIPVAMANEEFIVYYQPKVNSKTSTLCGAEALVRWLRNGSLVPPGQFIPILETKDLMCDMDFYMLRHVCADISKWIEQGLVPPTISVNFSRRGLSNSHLAEDIDAVVNEYHVPKKMIEIEITETIDEFPISVLNAFVDDLHRLGYKVAVDDFGSGSSSLSLLREVTFDTLKIDKGFVDRAYAKDLTILSYMIKLAKALGVEVLAEGVEQKEQVETLSSLGCDIIQGYYYDRPLPKENFEKRIISRRYVNG
ncbi:MAG: EAL domain-containing protein [Lachnospiraceae bacterium]|nr:EAL domain-containing protein [Lachnospiraceae bacterium]